MEFSQLYIGFYNDYEINKVFFWYGNSPRPQDPRITLTGIPSYKITYELIRQTISDIEPFIDMIDRVKTIVVIDDRTAFNKKVTITNLPKFINAHRSDAYHVFSKLTSSNKNEYLLIE